MKEIEDMEGSAVKRYREAGGWLLRLNREPPDEAEVADWLRWCEQDERNLQAFERMQSDWRDVVALRNDAAFVASRTTEPSSARRRSLWLAAAVLATLTLAAALWDPLHAWWATRDMQQIVAATANKSTALPDGSLLTLRAQASVNVGFTPQQRRLEVPRESEAYFKVRHDPARPFVVRAGPLTITAIGTAFDVRHETQSTWVTVEEGGVNISIGRGRWTAAAGQRLEYSPQTGSASVADVDAANALRWRDGEFAYVKVPLGAVIAEIGRYSSRRIAIPDERVREIPFTGTVFVQSLDDWLLALAVKYPVRAVSSANGDIVLESP
jgi:transmembrane sensor